jgi:hypothetical protein
VPGILPQLAPEFADRWIPAASAGMTLRALAAAGFVYRFKLQNEVMYGVVGVRATRPYSKLRGAKLSERR